MCSWWLWDLGRDPFVQAGQMTGEFRTIHCIGESKNSSCTLVMELEDVKMWKIHEIEEGPPKIVDLRIHSWRNLQIQRYFVVWMLQLRSVRTSIVQCCLTIMELMPFPCWCCVLPVRQLFNQEIEPKYGRLLAGRIFKHQEGERLKQRDLFEYYSSWGWS